MKIEYLKLCTKANTALHMNNINTIEELIRHSSEELKQMPRIGDIIINDIMDSLHCVGLHLKNDDYLIINQENLNIQDQSIRYLIKHNKINITKNLLAAFYSSRINSLNELFEEKDPIKIVAFMKSIRVNKCEEELKLLFNYFGYEYNLGILNDEIKNKEVDLTNVSIVNIDFGFFSHHLRDLLINNNYFYVTDILNQSEIHLTSKLRDHAYSIINTLKELDLSFNNFETVDFLDQYTVSKSK